MENDVPKQFLELVGKPILYYSIKVFTETFKDLNLIVVLPKTHFKKGKEIAEGISDSKNIQFVEGGETRYESVAAGLELVPNGHVVLVHDGARPLVGADTIRRVFEGARLHGSAVPVVPVADSIRQLSGLGSRSISRDDLRIVQTPQGFNSTVLKDAFKQPFRGTFTDEASVIDWQGGSVELVLGERCNFKITTPDDLIIAETMLRQRLAN